MQLENVNQVYRILTDAATALSAVLGKTVEIQVVNVELPPVTHNAKIGYEIARTMLKNLIVDAVCEQLMINRLDLRKKVRNRSNVDGRKIAADLLTKFVHGIRPTEVADMLNVHRSNVYNLVSSCEELTQSNKKFKFQYEQTLKTIKRRLQE